MYEVFLGSANVWIEGSRAGRVGVDITKHCIFTAPKPKDPPMGPMFGSTINCSPNVVIGGVPLPSLTSMATAWMFKQLFKGLGKMVGWLRGKLGKGVHGPPPRGMGRGPGGTHPPGVVPPPHMNVPEIPSPRVAVLARDVAPGARQVIKEI